VTPQIVLETRNQMLRDGYCIIEDIVTEDFLQEMRDETERLIANHEEPADLVYQGQHIGVKGADNPVIDKLLSWEPSYQALEELGFGDFKTGGGVIILTKEPHGPPLYWHQDWMQWNDPLTISPWPQIIFLNYYLSDTSVENGCLKVIPGSHHRRIPLHDKLVPAHEQGARFIQEDHPIMFGDDPEQIYLPVKAGSLVLGDARILHSAGRNHTDDRRTLILGWHRRPTDTVPVYWDGEVPEAIANRDPDAEYEGSRIPGAYLKPE
jgi:ectoine hydroxylase-related dioxygenase (phytanoyl-CoA dioxygenase family)